MKSVLLGGLKVWLVNDGGKPLSAPGGRAKFYRAGTSTPETVYSDIDLTQSDALGPVVYTDELGYLPAIWLKTDRLYKVRVEQKVPGSGNQWTLLWEVDNVGYIDRNTSDEIGDIPIFVNSISELKTVDHIENPVVEVLGYYNPGDWGEPSAFVFDPECLKAPDDGAYVLPSDQEQSVSGRWVQQFEGDVLDVRKFGALPDLLENSDCCAKVVNAINYSQSLANVGKTPIAIGFVAPGKYDFVGGFDFSIYYWTDLSNNSSHDIRWLICDGVVFNGVSINSSVTTFKLDKNTDCRVSGELVRGNTLLVIEGGGSIKVDPAWWGNRACTVQDCYVRCGSLTTNNKSFTRCEVESLRMIDGYVSLTEMRFVQHWFKDGFNYSNLILQDVVYSVNDCYNAESYIAIKNAQNDPNYGDLGEQTLQNVSLLPNAIAENAIFSNVTLTGTAGLHNVSGNVTIQGSAYDLNIIDCWLAINGTNITLDSLQWRRGSISSASQIQCMTACQMWDVDVNAQLLTNGVAADFERCRIKSAVTGQGIVCKDCHIDAVVTTSDVDGLVNFNFDGCYFGANGRHAVTATDPGAQVVGVWTNNFADTVHPIQLDMAKLANNDLTHTYRYENNNGKFLPRYPKVSIVLLRFHYVNLVSRHLQTIHSPVLCDQSLVLQPTGNKWFNGVYIPADWLPDCKFFAIGVAWSNWRLTVSYEFTDTTEMNDSMTPRTNHCYSSSADTNATVDDAANFKFDLFADKIIGPIVLAPKNFAMPTEITSADPATWPATNSAVATIERLL